MHKSLKNIKNFKYHPFKVSLLSRTSVDLSDNRKEEPAVLSGFIGPGRNQDLSLFLSKNRRFFIAKVSVIRYTDT
jgi:hypothetical protein